MNSFKDRLKQAMNLRNITQSELCEKTGIPKSAMSQYVSGAFVPKQERTYIIAKALNVNESWLLGYDDVSMERSLNNDFDNSDEDETLIILNRDAKKLSPENRKKLLEMAKLMFQEDFNE